MKKNQTFYLVLFACASIMLTSCIGFQVSSPKPTDFNAVYNGFSLDASGHLVIPVTFTETVAQSSVVVNKTLFLKFTKDPNAMANLSWSANSKELTITTVKTRDELMSFTPDDGFCLTLKGTTRVVSSDTLVVKSKAGLVLDGNYDGKPGGDYHMCFFIIG